MAKNEIVNVLTIKTEESQQTIKGLKKEIADLKKSLDNAVIGSEEFEKASKELAMAQAELKTVMADGKKTTDNMEGSYNHLVATMAELKKQWKATADEVKRDELGQQIDSINNQLKELDATIGDNQRKVGAYAEEFGKALEKNNNTVAASASAFKQALAEQDDATISTRAKLESVQKVATGLASGYAAVQGAMTLLNIENENLQKAMVKVQSVMAIAQGVGGMKDLVEGLGRAKIAFAGATNGVKTFIGGLSGVQKAIIGTGIGALVVAVGLLIANWEKITALFKDTTAIETAEEAIERLNSKIKENNDLFEQANAEALYRYSNALAAAGGDANKLKTIIANYTQELKDNEEQLLINNKIEAEKARYKAEVNRATLGASGYDENDKKFVEALEAEKAAVKELEKAEVALENFYFKNNLKNANDRIKAAEDRAKKQKAIDEELRTYNLTEEEKLIDTLDKKYIEYMKVYEGNQAKQLEILTWYTDEYTKIVEKGLDKQIAAQQKAAEESERIEKEKYEKKVAASEQRLDKKLTNIDSGAETAMYLNERQKPEGNGEINAIDNELSKIEKLKNITNETLNLKVAAIEAEQALFKQSSERWMELENQKVLLREQTNRTLLELEDQLKQQTEAKQRALAGSITKTFTAALSSASAIIGALQEGIDTTTKEGFEKNKKMQIAQATIQMLVGITTALSGAFTTKSGPWDWILAGIQAATIGATGAIQIANIKKQTFDSAGSGGASASVSPSMGFVDMPVSYTRNLMGDKETENLNQEQRVYILESDIEESGRRVEVRESNTNF